MWCTICADATVAKVANGEATTIDLFRPELAFLVVGEHREIVEPPASSSSFIMNAPHSELIIAL
jgi:hypothetical protein